MRGFFSYSYSFPPPLLIFSSSSRKLPKKDREYFQLLDRAGIKGESLSLRDW